MNFTGLINRFATGTYTVTRREPATVSTDGRADPVTATTLTIRASAQAIAGVGSQNYSGRELQRRTEGQRVMERRRLYTSTRLKVIGDPDVVTIYGEAWQVEREEDWLVLGNYGKYIIVKVGN